MSDRHKIIANEDVDNTDYNVWSAYVPEQIRFVNPAPYVTVVFTPDQRSVYEAFAEEEADALANQATVIEAILDGHFEEQVMPELELTEDQREAYKVYMIEELSTKIAKNMIEEQLERDPATGHHPDCDGECGGTGKPNLELVPDLDDNEGDDPYGGVGQYL
jgi:hypothetical protein